MLPAVPARTSITSYGLILFNREGKVLAIRRRSSYGFSSIFSMLLLQETTASRPDEFVRICRQLVCECSPCELKLLKDHWTPEGFTKILDVYLRRLPTEGCRDRISSEFQSNSVQVKCLWGILISEINISQVPPSENYRVHDVPKGRGCPTVAQIRGHFKYETGIQLPAKLLMGDWYDVSYISNTGVEYKMRLLAAKCNTLSLKEESTALWCSQEELKIHPAITKVIESSSKTL